jgi:hypothetical protein
MVVHAMQAHHRISPSVSVIDHMLQLNLYVKVGPYYSCRTQQKADQAVTSMTVGLLQVPRASRKGMAWQRLLHWMARSGRSHGALPSSTSNPALDISLLEPVASASRGLGAAVMIGEGEMPLAQLPYTPVLSARGSNVGSPSQQRITGFKWSPVPGQVKHSDVDQSDQVWTGDTAFARAAGPAGAPAPAATGTTSSSGSHTGGSSRFGGSVGPAPPSAVGAAYHMVTGTAGDSSVSQGAATSELLAVTPAQWLVTGTGTTGGTAIATEELLPGYQPRSDAM